MNAGLPTSVLLHASLLAFGLLTLSAPGGYEVADVEAFPVDIIPVQSITQVQEGDKKAPMAEKAAPVPTIRPDVVENATKVGEAAVDSDARPAPEEKPKPVETAAAPPPSPKPEPEPVREAEPVPAPEPEARQTPVPATEVTPAPQPRQDIAPEPAPETAVAEAPDAESVSLPETAPSPQARPQPPKAQTAKAPERKDAEKPVVEETAKRQSEEEEFDLDEVAALLNKDKPSGGGAKRSTETAALGGRTTTGGASLSQSEMDALRGQIQRCWNVPAGAVDAENLKVSVKFRLDPTGALEGRPEIVAGGGASGIERAAAESARRAVLQCAPYNLPADKYEAWADVLVNFDPSEMF